MKSLQIKVDKKVTCIVCEGQNLRKTRLNCRNPAIFVDLTLEKKTSCVTHLCCHILADSSAAASW